MRKSVIQYALHSRRNPNKQQIEISDVEFAELKKAIDNIRCLQAVEENLNSIIEDWIEFEKTLHDFSIQRLAFIHIVDDMPEIQATIGRKFLHVLSSARLYRDSLKVHAKLVFGRTEKFKRIVELVQDSQAQPMEYRIVEAIRDFTQHRAYSVSGTTLSSRWERNPDKPRDIGVSAYSVMAFFDPAEIANNRKISEDVRTELLGLKERTSITRYLRKYIEHIGKIHQEFRALTVEAFGSIETLIGSTFIRFDKVMPLGSVAPYIIGVSKIEDGEIVDTFDVFPEMFGRLKNLMRKNGTQANLSRRYVKWTDMEFGDDEDLPIFEE